jgi:NAD(P)-dependent dehydrogenase (short-subunit alcohol dehydrogenase family)
VSGGLVAGKVALVTGAGAGIGRASALLLAAEGAAVAVADINRETAEATVAAIRADGGRAVAFTADVAQADETAALVADVVSAFGALDCAHNNAGVENPLRPVHETSEADWDHVTRVDLKGTWLCMKAEIAHMLGAGGGSIVNTASVLGSVATANSPSYVSAKHGVLGLTRSAALDYAARGIRVNAVSPGAIRTELIDRLVSTGAVAEDDYVRLHPMGRLGSPAEVAEAVLWLCSDRSSFVTGHSLVVDGGYLAQ